MREMFLLFFVLLVGVSNGAMPFDTPLDEIKKSEGPEYWRKLGLEEIASTLKIKHNTNVAKNIILFIGDGLGMATITAARLLKKQTQNADLLFFEQFPFMALSQVCHLFYSNLNFNFNFLCTINNNNNNNNNNFTDILC
jgi:hypothetical protein